MKKIFTSILIMGLCTFLTAQSVLNISGTITSTNGDVLEGVSLTLSFDNTDEAYFTETNVEGYYEFTIDLPDDGTQGCFELIVIDCIFTPIIYSDCYNPGNTDFISDFVYCENDSAMCFSFIIPQTTGTGLVLSVFTFGVAPFTYEWSDGSEGETITVPADDEGTYCVTVTDSEGCVSENCIDLTPPDPCFVNIFQEYNFNESILFAEGYGQTDEIEYVWSTGQFGSYITISESGEYCVTLTDGLGCVSSDCGYFEVDTTWAQDCFAYIYSTYESDSTVETLVVEAFGVAPFTYVWTLGDVIVSTGQSYIPEEPGVYCVAVTAADGCVFTTCYEYNVWGDCGVWIGCDPTAAGILLVAYGFTDQPIEYLWSTGDVGQELLVTQSGEYCVTITTADGCTATSCIVVNVDDIPLCFTPIVVTEFNGFAELVVEPMNDGLYEFIWSTGEITSEITVTESGTYCVEVLEVASGCSYTTCATVYIGGQEECYGWIEIEYSSDSSAILSVFAVNMSNDSIGFQYMWSTGELTETIEVTIAGTYCVTVTSATGANSCVFETCIDVTFSDFPEGVSILGQVIDSETGGGLLATVEIYSILDDGSLELYADGIETMEEGVFVVNGVEAGQYIALAIANEEGYVPTYSYSSTYWATAEVYQIGNDVAFILLQISMIPINDVSGFGSISGAVSTANLVANGKESDARNGTPVVGANVMLMFDGDPVRQMFTDDEGNYFFSSLPYGTYNVVLEIPGQTQKIVKVTLTEDNPNVTDVVFETDDSVLATENITALSLITLSPNPTSNTLIVETFFKEVNALKYSVIDMNGKVVETSDFKVVEGENVLQLDVNNFKNGVYTLILQSKDEIFAKRFIKM